MRSNDEIVEDNILLQRKDSDENKDAKGFWNVMKKTLLEIIQLDFKSQLPFWVPFIWYFFPFIWIIIQITVPLLFILFYFSPRIITKLLKYESIQKLFKKQEFHGIFDNSYFSYKGIQVRGTDVFYKDRKMLVTVSEIKGLLPWSSLFTIFRQLPRWKSKKKVAKGLYILNAFGKGVNAEYFLKKSGKIPPLPIFLQLFSMEYMFSGDGNIEDIEVKLNRDADKKPSIFLKGKKLHAVNKPDENIPHALVTGWELEVQTHTDTIKFDFAKGELPWTVIRDQFRRKPLQVRNLVMRGITGNIDGQERDKTRIPQENDMENWTIHGVNATEVDLILKPFWKRPEAKIHMIIDEALTNESFILQRLPNALVYHSKTFGSLDGKEFKIEQISYCFSPTAEVTSPPTGDCVSSDVLSDSEDDTESFIERKNARLFLLPPLPSSFWSDKLALPLFSMFPNAQFGFRVISTDDGARYRWRVKGTIVREGKPEKTIELKRVFIEKKIVENCLVFGAETSELVSVLTDATKNLIYDGVKVQAEKAKKMFDNSVSKISAKMGPMISRTFSLFSSPEQPKQDDATSGQASPDLGDDSSTRL